MEGTNSCFYFQLQVGQGPLQVISGGNSLHREVMALLLLAIRNRYYHIDNVKMDNVKMGAQDPPASDVVPHE